MRGDDRTDRFAGDVGLADGRPAARWLRFPHRLPAAHRTGHHHLHVGGHLAADSVRHQLHAQGHQLGGDQPRPSRGGDGGAGPGVTTHGRTEKIQRPLLL
ncbi:MAG: hypothetical protein FJX74_23135 [Armatimonadetes bacterium]|nr:hypothetical protein [Armatimonadota bacterium]